MNWSLYTVDRHSPRRAGSTPVHQPHRDVPPDDLRGRRGDPPWWPQSLGVGVLAVALLHIERARVELAPWQRAHDWLQLAASGPLDVGPDSHPHYGAPALAFVLHTATDERPGRYDRALATLDHHVAAAARRRPHPLWSH
jgi:hypothetical protein